MKLTILGAASPRFPLLLNSLLRRENLSIGRVCLFDLNRRNSGCFQKRFCRRFLPIQTNDSIFP